MAEGITLELDGDIEISLPIGHVTGFCIRCPKCGNIYTQEPFDFGHCPVCGFKKETSE
jgi:rRNA maturation endonuclease Nob1